MRKSRRVSLTQELASPIERLRAVGYDLVVLTLTGSIFMTGYSWISGRDPIDDSGALSWCILGLLLLSALCDVPSTALVGQTVGKHIVGIRVVAINGSRPGWVRSLLRWACSIPFGVLPEGSLVAGAVVGISVLADPLSRGLHDRVAGTIVVRVTRTTPAARLRPRKRR